MNIEWNKVTWYSQVVAIVLFVGVFVLGLFIGMHVGSAKLAAMQPAVGGVARTSSGAPVVDPNAPIVATYTCDARKQIQATFLKNSVKLLLTDGRSLSLPHALSADGARYANANESIVFWNVGQTAFMTEGSKTTFANCKQIAAPINQ